MNLWLFAMAALAGKDSGPAASAAEIPVLADLLEKAGWDPTPELSGVYKAGSVFAQDGASHALMVRQCFAAEVVSDSYTSAEVVSNLQAGVRVRVGAVSASGSGELVKKVKFGAPVHTTMERLSMQPTPECRDKLARVPAGELATMYAVQEVLTAEIAEQTCGRIDASGKFVGIGSIEGELAQACTQVSLEPVAVAYRVVAMTDVLGRREQVSAAVDCPYGPIGSAWGSFGRLVINGQTYDVTGYENRVVVIDALQRCGLTEAAHTFERWRSYRRTTNIACATLVGCYPFGIGIWSAVRAGKERRELEALLLGGEIVAGRD